MRYTALTTTGPFDIGEFEDQDSAQAWAAQRFGDDLQAVMVQQNDSVTVTADPRPPGWAGWLLLPPPPLSIPPFQSPGVKPDEYKAPLFQLWVCWRNY